MFERLKPRPRPIAAQAAEPAADVAAPVAPAPSLPPEPAAAAPQFAAAEIVDAVHAEAVRLAALACERALRDTVKRTPHAIRAFVRDAMCAAGYPSDADACVSMEDLPDALSAGLRVRGDASLERGAVAVAADGCRVHASPQARAELLVRSAVS